MTIDWNKIIDNVKNCFTLNNHQNIVCLNINSFMGGVKDIWKKSNQDQLLQRYP